MNTSSRIAAVIGCGRYVEGKEGWAIGHEHAAGYRKADPGLRLLGVDPNPENLRAFGERFGVAPGDLFPSTDALYAAVRPDFVSVCTWPALHAPQVIEAATRGVRGIICEKPMALNGGEIDAMLAACAEHGARLAIAHQRAYGPGWVLARELLHGGSIGDDWVIEARVGGGWDILSWSVHWLDMAHWLFGEGPLSVLAGLQHTGKRLYQHAVEDASVVFVEYPQRRQAIFVTGPDSHLGEFVVRGTRGMLRIRGDGVDVFNETGYRTHTPDSSGPDGFHALVLDLFNAVATGAPMRCDAARSALSTRTAYAVHESARLCRVMHAPFTISHAPLELLQNPPRPRLPEGKIVLFADEHYGSGGREGIAEALQALTGEEPRVIDATRGLRSTDLDGAGMLLLYHTQSEPDEGTRAALTAWVEEGRPTVFVHCAVGGYPQWELYKQWAGRVWVWGGSIHPHEPCTLRPVGPDFAGWASAWLPRDEVFARLGAVSEVDDQLEAIISTGPVPAAWQSRRWPHITAWIPGHRGDLWTVPALRQGLLTQMQRAASAARQPASS